MNRHLKRWESAALLALCLILLAASRTQGEREELADNLIRLHVIAVSDDAEEQALKLRVRDAVLRYLEPLLDGVSDKAEAEERLFAELKGIALSAAEAAEGRQVTVTLGPADYPTKSFETYTLPAGRYESLRVILGEGEGHNWWGLVFPQLCLPAAQTDVSTEDTLRETLSRDSFALVTEGEGCEIRFRLLELWDALIKQLQ